MFKFLFSPYVKIGRTVASTAKNLSKLSHSVKDDLARMSNDGADTSGIKTDAFIEASTPEIAFQKLYESNHWTPEKLERQYRVVRRTKWLSILALWLSFCLTIGVGLFTRLGFFSIVSMVLISLVTLFFAVSTLRFSLFQAQIQLRSILSVREFFSRHDLFMRIFS